MIAKQIIDGVYIIPLGIVNVFLLESIGGLILIDTGIPGGADQIIQTVNELGKQPDDINHIFVTHWHMDHMGGLAELKRVTGAQTYAHPLDTPIICEGGKFDLANGIPRHSSPSPGLDEMFQDMAKTIVQVEGAPIDHEIQEGDVLPFLPELKVIDAPGHSKGQVVFLWQAQGGVLFAADTCSNVHMLYWSLGYEDFEEAKRTLKKLCNYDFEIATFGHGESILEGADAKWREKWGSFDNPKL